MLVSTLGIGGPTLITYHPDTREEDFRTASGKVLIRYDPATAILQQPGGCISQVAEVELWFEDAPHARYQDRWIAFSDQIVPDSGSGGSISERNIEKRLLKGMEVTIEKEEEWKVYESLTKRQIGGSCSRPSQAISVSSVATVP